MIAYADEPPARLRGEEWTEHKRALRELGERLTGEALLRAREAGVEAEATLVPERPVDALVDLAEKRGARMIVVGSHGEGALRGALLGSVCYKLVHHAPVPALVGPAGS